MQIFATLKCLGMVAFIGYLAMSDDWVGFGFLSAVLLFDMGVVFNLKR